MTGFIHLFASHRIAPNLLMLLMLLSGFFAIGRVEVRFFPEFERQVVNVRTSWQSASAEDVASSLLTPMENELRNVPDLKNMSSYARDGYGVVYLEFADGKDLDKAAADIRRYLDLVQSKLPSDSEAPEVQSSTRRDDVMSLSLAGGSLAELRRLARQLEIELLRLGVVQVAISGLPPDEVQIELSRQQLQALGLTARDIGRQIANQNIDVSAGDIDGNNNSRLVRSLSQGQALQDFERLQLLDGNGNILRLGDIATVRRYLERDNTTLFFNGKPAVEFILTRKSGGNTLDAAKSVLAWREQTLTKLPAGITLTPHRERWLAVQSRMDLLINNGLQGLVLVLIMLLLFLNMRLALWVAAGIPATFMVALSFLHFTGGSLNMISMFAFIMVTGIVVDDAIVVGENGFYHLKQGKSPLNAAVDGAKEMFVAVFSSTFTTIASFLPLLIVGGTIGSIIIAIPTVVVCVLVASLFECFFVLPGHMRHAFSGVVAERGNRYRQALDNGFTHFEQHIFRRSITLALRYRWVTVTTAFVMLTLAIALIMGGLLKFRFFPGAELNRVQAQINFVAGTPKAEVERFMHRLRESLHKTATAFPEEENLLRHVSIYMGEGSRRQGSGDEKAKVVAELSQPEDREISTRDFIRVWRKNLPQQAGLESVSLREARGGPAGEDLEIRLAGNNITTLKEAANELKTALLDIPGVSRPADDLPYGKQQTIFELTPLGQALNLSAQEVASQLRNAYNGFRVQTLYEGVNETVVRVAVREVDGSPLGDFNSFLVKLPNGEFVALEEVATLKSRSGFNTIQRVNTEIVVNVVGNIDFAVTDVDRVQQQLKNDVLPLLQARHGFNYSFEGSSADQRETISDMRTGLIMALLSIFVILAAVFASWSLPLVILLTVPFGIIGAMVGHWVLGYDMSILSAFGVFTLSGIIVNDSIILVRDYLSRVREQPDTDRDTLIVDSVCRRLRAILLTSLTTIGGLIPLMFETSVQAQFLIPMAVSICFGLGFATLLILYLTPAYLSIHNSIGGTFNRLLRRTPVAGNT
ncbi:MAG: efflux RND transporter permease subunit [Proteobacteria bacterium]|nr:efflux RND transporter permease subunit [Pseudomonadota bacterium]